MFGPSLQVLGRALLMAAAYGETEEVIAVLDQGADIEATDDWVSHCYPIAVMVFILHV